MTREELMEVAFRFRTTRIWKYLQDNEVFAVKLRNEQIGYVSLIGKYGTYSALGLYVGDDGIRCFMRLIQARREYRESNFKEIDAFKHQKALHVVFAFKDRMTPEEYVEAMEFMKKNSIKAGTGYPFPRFIKYDPDRGPLKMRDPNEMDLLCDAMEITLRLIKMPQIMEPSQLGINQVDENTLEIPLFEIRFGQLQQCEPVKVPRWRPRTGW